jgi:tetratricopeptide (TPR) repeat protein
MLGFEPPLLKEKFMRFRASQEKAGTLETSAIAELGQALRGIADVSGDSALLFMDELPFLLPRVSLDQVRHLFTLAGWLYEETEDSCFWWDYCKDTILFAFTSVWHRAMMDLGFDALVGVTDTHLKAPLSLPGRIVFWKILLPLVENLGPSGPEALFTWLGRLSEAFNRHRVAPDEENDRAFDSFHIDAMERIPLLMELYSPDAFWKILDRVGSVQRSDEALIRGCSNVPPEDYAAFLGCTDIRRTDEPVSYSVAMRLSLAAQNTGAFARAGELLERAVEFSPRSSSGTFNLGMVQYRLGKYAEAVKTLTRCVGLHPRDIPAWYMLTKAHESAGDLPLARECLLRGLELNTTAKFFQSPRSGAYTWVFKSPDDYEPHFRKLQERVGG